MDIRTLEYFLAVAREGSITGAAQALHMTQPPLSRQMQDLEKELGTQLFVRGPKQITLTEAGLLLRRRAEEMMGLLEKTKTEISSTDSDVRGEVSIGAGQTPGVALLARAAGRLHAAHPHVRFLLRSGDAPLIRSELDNGLVDFGLFVGQVDTSRYESLRLPVRDTWGILMRRDSPLAEKSAVCAADLLCEPLLFPRQISSSGELQAWFGRSLSELNVVVRGDLIYNTALFAAAGMGYAVTLDGLVNTTGDSTFCFRPLSPPMTADLVVAWKKHQSSSRAAREFLRLLTLECELVRQADCASSVDAV